MFRNIITIVFFVLCCSFNTANDNCLALFKVAFEKMKDISPLPGRGLEVKYSASVQTSDGSFYTDNIDLRMYEKKYKVVSTDASIYQDDKTMVIVRSQSNTIFITRPMDQNIRKMKMNDLLKLQDSILAYLVLKSCVDDVKYGANFKRLDFKMPLKIQSKIGVTSATYWLDTKNVSIKKIELNYKAQEGQRLKTSLYEFDLIDRNFSSKPFDGPAIEVVLDNKNNLKPAFKNYSLIDNRKVQQN